MEKVFDHYIRDVYLVRNPINGLRLANQRGKSTETAMRNNISRFVVNWTLEMLVSWVITFGIENTSWTIGATRGCHQGVFYNLFCGLWSLMGLSSLTILVSEPYAGDLDLCVTGWDGRTISKLMQHALRFTLKWCQEKGLNRNPSNTILVPSTWRRKMCRNKPSFQKKKTCFSDNVKYFGVVLDRSLTWSGNLDMISKRPTWVMFSFEMLFGREWDIRPKIVNCSYNWIVKPLVTYDSLAWWTKVEQLGAQMSLKAVIDWLALASLVPQIHVRPMPSESAQYSAFACI